MSYLIKLHDLQLFADGGAAGGEGGGDGGAGVNPADAGQARLMELGVPQNKIRKNRAYAVPEVKAPEQRIQEAKTEEKAEQAAADEEKAPEAPETNRMSWEEIMADPEYKKEMSKMMRARVKEGQAAQDRLDKLTPALELLSQHLGMDMTDTENFDIAKFTEAVANGTRFYEKKADEMGVSEEMARHIDTLERQQAQREIMDKKTAEDQRMQEHFIKLQQQGEELKKTFPSFDLQTELQNPTFMRMTGPGVNLSVADAYYAVHREEIQKATMQAAAQSASEKLSNSIQAGKSRPVENGAKAQPASMSTFDYRNMTREQREAFKKQIYQAAARGEKLFPGR